MAPQGSRAAAGNPAAGATAAPPRGGAQRAAAAPAPGVNDGGGEVVAPPRRTPLARQAHTALILRLQEDDRNLFYAEPYPFLSAQALMDAFPVSVRELLHHQGLCYGQQAALSVHFQQAFAGQGADAQQVAEAVVEAVRGSRGAEGLGGGLTDAAPQPDLSWRDRLQAIKDYYIQAPQEYPAWVEEHPVDRFTPWSLTEIYVATTVVRDRIVHSAPTYAKGCTPPTVCAHGVRLGQLDAQLPLGWLDTRLSKMFVEDDVSIRDEYQSSYLIPNHSHQPARTQWLNRLKAIMHDSGEGMGTVFYLTPRQIHVAWWIYWAGQAQEWVREEMAADRQEVLRLATEAAKAKYEEQWEDETLQVHKRWIAQEKQRVLKANPGLVRFSQEAPLLLCLYDCRNRMRDFKLKMKEEGGSGGPDGGPKKGAKKEDADGDLSMALAPQSGGDRGPPSKASSHKGPVPPKGGSTKGRSAKDGQLRPAQLRGVSLSAPPGESSGEDDEAGGEDGSDGEGGDEHRLLGEADDSQYFRGGGVISSMPEDVTGFDADAWDAHQDRVDELQRRKKERLQKERQSRLRGHREEDDEELEATPTSDTGERELVHSQEALMPHVDESHRHDVRDLTVAELRDLITQESQVDKGERRWCLVLTFISGFSERLHELGQDVLQTQTHLTKFLNELRTTKLAGNPAGILWETFVKLTDPSGDHYIPGDDASPYTAIRCRDGCHFRYWRDESNNRSDLMAPAVLEAILKQRGLGYSDLDQLRRRTASIDYKLWNKLEPLPPFKIKPSLIQQLKEPRLDSRTVRADERDARRVAKAQRATEDKDKDEDGAASSKSRADTKSRREEVLVSDDDSRDDAEESEENKPEYEDEEEGQLPEDGLPLTEATLLLRAGRYLFTTVDHNPDPQEIQRRKGVFEKLEMSDQGYDQEIAALARRLVSQSDLTGDLAASLPPKDPEGDHTPWLKKLVRKDHWISLKWYKWLRNNKHCLPLIRNQKHRFKHCKDKCIEWMVQDHDGTWRINYAGGERVKSGFDWPPSWTYPWIAEERRRLFAVGQVQALVEQPTVPRSLAAPSQPQVPARNLSVASTAPPAAQQTQDVLDMSLVNSQQSSASTILTSTPPTATTSLAAAEGATGDQGAAPVDGGGIKRKKPEKEHSHKEQKKALRTDSLAAPSKAASDGSDSGSSGSDGAPLTQ